MHRSSALLLVVALAALAGVTGCSSSDDESSAPPPTAAASSAPKAPAADRLDTGDAAILRNVGKTVAQYCASGHKATAGEVTGAVATLESLYEIDPAAVGSDDKTVKQVARAAERTLRACGNRSAAKRLAKLTD